MVKLLSSISDLKDRLNEFKTIPASVSNRHIHLTRETIDVLFGKGYQLTKFKDLSQPGQFAAEETAALIGPKGRFDKVRILGPERKEDQCEIAVSDSYKLGIKNVPVAQSGDLAGSAGMILEGPKGAVKLEKGLIAAANHVHCSPKEARDLGVKDKDRIDLLSFKESRIIVFADVLVRVNENFALDFHIDIDEANSAGIRTGDKVYLIAVKRNIKNSGKKIFLTERKLKEILSENPDYRLEDNVVLTPAARDYARSKKLIMGYKRLK